MHGNSFGFAVYSKVHVVYVIMTCECLGLRLAEIGIPIADVDGNRLNHIHD